MRKSSILISLSESRETSILFDTVEEWFVAIKRKQLKQRHHFPIEIISRMIALFLRDDNYISTATFLHFLFNNFNAFDDKFQLQVLRLIFMDNFCDLFFHWSIMVRQVINLFLCFHLIMMFRSGQNKQIIKMTLQEVNAKINIVHQAFFHFDKRKFNWNKLAKHRKRTMNVNQILKNVIDTFVYNKDANKTNYFLYENNADESIQSLHRRASMDEDSGFIKKYQEYFSESATLEVKKDNFWTEDCTDTSDEFAKLNLETPVTLKLKRSYILYCEVSINEWRLQLRTFKDEYKRKTKLSPSEFPYLKWKGNLDA